MPSAWISFPCSSVQARWRYLDDGHIELEDAGLVLPKRWPTGVDKWREAIHAMAAKYQVPAIWIAAIMTVEDPAGDPIATSSAGAMGLMQLMPATGRMVAKNIGRPISSDSELYDPLLNLELGVAHLAGLIKRYKGDFVSAATAYNAGQIICLTPTTKCQKGYWGVCTDGSPYPLWAIQGVNGAIANGYDKNLVPPPALFPQPAPWAIAAAAFSGAFLGFMATRTATKKIKTVQKQLRAWGYA